MILCFGGTFDPVHIGHLAVARMAAGALGVPVRLMLSAWPVHRDQPSAPIEQRFELLRLACAPYPELQPDDREIRAEAPSYTVHTLEALRREHSQQPIGWLMGRDSLLTLDSWHQWPRLLELGHLVVFDRGGYDDPLPAVVATALEGRWHSGLPSQPAGQVITVSGRPPAVSSTAVRKALAAGQPIAHLLPTGVFSYIRNHNLYGALHGSSL